MRAGTILRVVGIIVFLFGLVLGVLIVVGTKYLITTYPAEIYDKDFVSSLSWGVAISFFVSIAFSACLIFTVGTMSNNLDEINIKMEDVQSNTLDTAKALRYITHIVNTRLPQETANVQAGGTESIAQYSPRSYMRTRVNSTDV